MATAARLRLCLPSMLLVTSCPDGMQMRCLQFREQECFLEQLDKVWKKTSFLLLPTIRKTTVALEDALADVGSGYSLRMEQFGNGRGILCWTEFSKHKTTLTDGGFQPGIWTNTNRQARRGTPCERLCGHFVAFSV